MKHAGRITASSAARLAVVSIGFCLYLALISLSSWSTPTYLSSTVGTVENALGIFYPLFWLASLSCFIFFLFSSKIHRVFRFMLKEPFVACILPAGFFLLICASYLPLFQLGFLVVAGILVGWGNAGYLIVWEKILFSCGVQKSKMVLVIATLLSILPYSSVAYLSQQEQLLAVTFIIAPLCLVFLLIALRISTPSTSNKADGKDKVDSGIDSGTSSLYFSEKLPDRAMLRKSLIPLVCIFSLGIISPTISTLGSIGMDAADQVFLSHVACVICAVILFVFWILRKSSIPITTLFYVIFPFIGMALAFLAFGPKNLWLPIVVLVKMILILLSMVTMINCLEIARRCQIGITSIFALYGFVLLFSQSTGILLSSLIGRVSTGDNELVLATVVIIYILSLVLVAILFLRRKQIEKTEKSIEPEQQLDRTKSVCETLSTSSKLTNREAEVLVLLARGRNAKSIAKQLYLSENTVRTYIKQIYQKLGIHSKQELFNLLDEHLLDQ